MTWRTKILSTKFNWIPLSFETTAVKTSWKASSQSSLSTLIAQTRTQEFAKSLINSTKLTSAKLSAPSSIRKREITKRSPSGYTHRTTKLLRIRRLRIIEQRKRSQNTIILCTKMKRLLPWMQNCTKCLLIRLIYQKSFQKILMARRSGPTLKAFQKLLRVKTEISSFISF